MSRAALVAAVAFQAWPLNSGTIGPDPYTRVSDHRKAGTERQGGKPYAYRIWNLLSLRYSVLLPTLRSRAAASLSPPQTWSARSNTLRS